MKIFATIQKWAALVGVRQASAPTIESNTSAVFFDTDGKPKLVIDSGGVETVHHVPKTQNAGHEVTFTTTASTGTSSPLTLPTSGMLATEAVADSKDTAAIGAHNTSSGVHGISGTVVGTSDSQSLSNKKLIDSTTTIVDVADNTKVIAFDAAGTAGTKTTIASSQTTDKVITLPDATDTVAVLAAQQELTSKKLTGGTASTSNQWTIPSKSDTTSLNTSAGNIMFDTTAKKIKVADGTDWKVVGGGLIPVTVTVSGTTPSIATLESGKHYVVDMSTATGDVSLTAPAAVAEVNFKVSVLKNFTSSWRVSINRAGSDNFYYNNQTDTAIRLYNPESWAEFFYLSSALFGLNTDESGSSSGSSGQGRKNYILNPSAFSSATDNWTAANFTVSRDISTAIPRETTTGTAFKLISTSTTAILLSDARLLDDTDLSKKLGVEIALNVADSSNWTIDILASATAGGTYARLPLSTDVSGATTLPATVGVFKTTVDTVAATPYIKFRITSAATAKTAYFSDILVTPDGNTVVGPVIEEWKSYTPTFNGLGTPTNIEVSYQRIGPSVRVYGRFLPATPTAAEARVSLPLGLTLAPIPAAGALTICGRWNRNNATASTRKTGVLLAQSGYAYVRFGSDDAATASSPATALNGNDFVGNEMTYVDFTVPIAEWAGSGTVNLAQNDEEYAFNTDVSATASVTASGFGYGSQGVNFPSTNWTIGTEWIRRVYFQAPIQASSDRIELEVNDGDGWEAVSARLPLSFVNSKIYGPRIVGQGSNYVDVGFSSGGCNAYSAATYGANGDAWTTLSAWKWRVRKTSGGKAIGFSHVVPGVSAGLVPAAGLPGRTDGVAVSSGYVGEIVGAVKTGGTGGQVYYTESTTNITTVATAMVSHTVNKGEYLATAFVQIAKPANTNIERVTIGIGIGGTLSGSTFISPAVNISEDYTSVSLSFPIVVTADSTAVTLRANTASDTSRLAWSRFSLVRIA